MSGVSAADFHVLLGTDGVVLGGGRRLVGGHSRGDTGGHRVVDVGGRHALPHVYHRRVEGRRGYGGWRYGYRHVGGERGRG